MSAPSEDRIHIATPARRQQARREGDVPKSFELAAAVQMIGAIMVSYLFLGQLGQWIRAWTTQNWSSAGVNLSIQSNDLTAQIQSAIFASVGVLAPMMILLIGCKPVLCLFPTESFPTQHDSPRVTGTARFFHLAISRS